MEKLLLKLNSINKEYLYIAVAAVLLLAVNFFMLFGGGDNGAGSAVSESTAALSDSIVVSMSDIASGADAVASGSDVTSSSDTAPLVTATDVQQPEKIVMTELTGAAAQRLDGIAAEYNCVGLSAAVIIDGQVAYNYEYGYTDRQMSREVDSATKFRIASLSKVVTSLLGMKLVEDGKINLDGDISDILGRKTFNPSYYNTPITMRMLLTHTSSFKDKSPIFSTTLKSDLINEKSYLTRKPGTVYNYTNLGIGIAGAAIEKASGVTISEYADAAFFNGMGIDAAYNGVMLDDKTNVAECIYVGSVQLDAEELVAPRGTAEPGENHTLGAGALLISAVDYAKLMTVLLNDGMYEGVQYLSPETISTIQEPQFACQGFDQCIGLRRSSSVIDGRTVYYHTGAAEGVFSMVVYDAADKSGVVILSTGASDYYYENGMRHICLKTITALYEDVIAVS